MLSVCRILSVSFAVLSSKARHQNLGKKLRFLWHCFCFHFHLLCIEYHGRAQQETNDKSWVLFLVTADESDSGVGLCGLLLTMISWALVLVTMPFSLCVCFKVVQEYERAVIFRLGRLLHGGSRGPGNFLLLPSSYYTKVYLIHLLQAFSSYCHVSNHIRRWIYVQSP